MDKPNQVLQSDSRKPKKYVWIGFFIGVFLVFLIGVIYVIRTMVKIGSCGPVPCTPLSISIFGMLHFSFYTMFLWWLVMILFITPIVTGLLIDKVTNNEKTAKSIMIVASFLALIIGLFIVLTPLGQEIEYQTGPKPNDFIPEKCVLPTGFVCTNYKIQPNKATIDILNSLGNDITVKNINIHFCGGSVRDGVLASGETKSFTIGGSCNNGKVGDKYKEAITIVYEDKATGLTKTVDGWIATKIVQ